MIGLSHREFWISSAPREQLCLTLETKTGDKRELRLTHRVYKDWRRKGKMCSSSVFIAKMSPHYLSA